MRTHLLRLVLVLACLATPGALARAADPMFGGRWITGDGPGFDNDFVTFETFMSLVDTSTDMTFFNARGIWDYEETLMGSNFGLGYRMYMPKSDRMFGLNAYYDLRDTDFDFYHQLGMGFESVGPHWDFRSNFYVPVKTNDELIDQFFSDPFMQGNNIVRTRTDVIQSALPGFDMEVGLALPVPFDAKMYGGWYGYEEADHDTEFGWKARLQAQLTDNIAASVGVADDQIFGTTVNLGLAWYWRGYLPKLGYEGEAGRCTGYRRLSTPVERNYWVAVDAREVRNIENLTHLVSFDDGDSFVRQEIIVRHIDPSDTGSQDLGTFEDPFLELETAQAFSDPHDILFVTGTPFDTTGKDTGIILANGQRLLADGHPHYVSTVELGDILLPGVDPARVGQTITDIEGGTIVELNDNTEVSGFRIIDSQVSAITGFNIIGQDFSDETPFTNQRGITINRNDILDLAVVGNDGTGIALTSASGIVNIGVADRRDTAVLVPDWGNEIAGHAVNGIFANWIPLNRYIETFFTIQNNDIHDNGTLLGGIAFGDGIQFQVVDNSALFDFTDPVHLSIYNNRIIDNFRHGIGFTTVGNDADLFQPVVDVNISYNNISDNGTVFADNTQGDGIRFNVTDQATVTSLIIDHNIVGRDVVAMAGEGNANHGINITANGTGDDRARMDLEITNNSITANGPPPFVDDADGDGIHIDVAGNAEIDGLLISRNIIGFDPHDPGSRGNSRDGIEITATGDEDEDAYINALIEDNLILDNGALVGPVIILPVGSGINITGNINDDAAPPLDILVRRNTINFNQLHGVEVQNLDETDMILSITDNNVIENNGSRVPDGTPFGSGIDIVSDGDNRLDLIVGSSIALGTPGNRSISSNFIDGITLTLLDSTESETIINDNLYINNNGSVDLLTSLHVGNGITIEEFSFAFLDLEIRRNHSIADSFVDGLFVNSNDDSFVMAAIADNTLDGNGSRNQFDVSFGHGIFLLASDDSTMDFNNVLVDDQIRNNSVTDSELSGVHIIADNTGIADFLLYQNIVADNGNLNLLNATDDHHGIFAQSTANDPIFRLQIFENLVERSGLDNIRVDLAGDAGLVQVNRNAVRDAGRDNISFNRPAGADGDVNDVEINDNIVEDAGQGVDLAGNPIVGDGIVVQARGDANDFDFLGNVIRNTVVGLGNREGINIVATGTANDFRVFDNDVLDSTEDNIFFRTLAVDNDIQIHDNNLQRALTGHGLQLQVESGGNDIEVFRNRIEDSGIDGVNYLQTAGANVLEIRDNQTISGNADDGIDIRVAGGSLRAGVTNNPLTGNGDFGFVATNLPASTIVLQFFANNGGGNGAAADYMFDQAAPPFVDTFTFENPFFDEVLPTFPLYAGGTNQPGTFIFFDFDGSEDRPLGTAGFGIFPGPF